MFPDIKPGFSHVERLLADFAKKDKPTIADFNALGTLGSVYDSLDRYRIKAQSMNRLELEAETHSSRRLSRNLTRAGDYRPSQRCDAHAIVSGGHRDAIVVRGVLAWLKMRIDDPHNGCWLPRDWADRYYMPNHLRNAVPHKRIHHEKYYQWLRNRIHPQAIKTPEQLILALRLTRVMLQSGQVPPSVMPQTGR
jgi:hypothetical protein